MHLHFQHNIHKIYSLRKTNSAKRNSTRTCNGRTIATQLKNKIHHRLKHRIAHIVNVFCCGCWPYGQEQVNAHIACRSLLSARTVACFVSYRQTITFSSITCCWLWCGLMHLIIKWKKKHPPLSPSSGCTVSIINNNKHAVSIPRPSCPTVASFSS